MLLKIKETDKFKIVSYLNNFLDEIDEETPLIKLNPPRKYKKW